MIFDSIKVTGAPHIVLRDSLGNIKTDFTVPNLVVSSGKTFLAARAVGTPTVMSHMSIGTGNTAPAGSQTTLTTEIARVALTSGTSSGNVITYVASFPAGVGTGSITEAGIFNASSAGTMLARTTFGSVNKDVGDSLTISWSITIA